MNVKEVFSWGMYDLANTIFSALFVTFFFPFFIVYVLGGSEIQVSIVYSASMLLVGLIVPFLGAYSDHVGKRMPFIAVFTVICCVLTAFIASVSLTAALIMGFFANVSYHAAITLYNALLAKIAKKDEMGTVSGIGTAMGYLGTLIGIGCSAIVLSFLGWETKEGIAAGFVVTAVLFFVFSLFMFFGVHEKKKKLDGKSAWTYMKRSVREVFKTLINIRSHKRVFYFVLSMFFFSNAVAAVILFLFLFAKQQIHLSMQVFFVVYVIQSFGAVVGSYAAGKLVDRFGSKRVLMWSGFGWIGVILMLFFVRNIEMFTVAGTIGGVFMGMWTAAQRPKLLALVPNEHAGQFFGYLELTGKFSGVLGPLTFGVLAQLVNYSVAMLSLIVFFVLGLICLKAVPGDVK